MQKIKTTITILLLSLLLAAAAFAQETTTETPAQAGGDAAQMQPKKDGVIRIGVVLPKAQIAAADGGAAAQDLSEPVRQSLISFMTAPTVELVPLDTRVAATIKLEAEQKGCDFVLYTALSRRQKTSVFGSLIKIAAPVVATTLTAPPAQNANQSNATDDGSVKQTAAQGVANGIAASIKAKDSFELEFSLTSADAATVKASSVVRVKAKNNGEDILTALVEQASNQILEAALKS